MPFAAITAVNGINDTRLKNISLTPGYSYIFGEPEINKTPN